MGNATTICSDKTGTLTTNRMTVVDSYINGNHYKGEENQPNGAALPGNTVELLTESISLNCAYNSMIVEPAKLGEQLQQLGNKTECGLLGFVQRLGGDYATIRKKFPEESLVKVYTFNSSRKSMMTVINLMENGVNVGYRVHCKGASEIILSRCTYLIGSDGKPHVFDADRLKEITSTVISQMANNGLRTICVAYKDYIRRNVREADATEIAFDNDIDIDWDDEQEISKNFVGIAICGIQANGKVSQTKLDQIWPRLRVLARAQPADKYTLVKGIIDSKNTYQRSERLKGNFSGLTRIAVALCCSF
ncbi:hypothetical protein KIN20_016742 [Parelaphostrongylus tenuis]|uniref:Uncharacterized protein n=1 Tax=Parelaphostrongylus tenuis TaxID=148309 RepID=A0AAD5N5P1_PARTN|nr:hypothetical protein KIN20_016742 [Parelaphostrongylus tenuis]